MENDKYDWGTLLDKYVRDEITPAEMEELEGQIKACPIKRRLFKQRTDPEELRKQLWLIYYTDRTKSWEIIASMLRTKRNNPNCG